MRAGKREAVTGEAWLDREWSSDYLAPDDAGWNWTGLNFDDGSALMAFRIRRKGSGVVWAGGSYRRADGRVTRLAPGDVAFAAARTWRSPRTGATYPVAQWLTVRLPEAHAACRFSRCSPTRNSTRASGGSRCTGRGLCGRQAGGGIWS